MSVLPPPPRAAPPSPSQSPPSPNAAAEPERGGAVACGIKTVAPIGLLSVEGLQKLRRTHLSQLRVELKRIEEGRGKAAQDRATLAKADDERWRKADEALRSHFKAASAKCSAAAGWGGAEQLPLLAERVLGGGCHISNLTLTAVEQELAICRLEYARAESAMKKAERAVAAAEHAARVEKERSAAMLMACAPTP